MTEALSHQPRGRALRVVPGANVPDWPDAEAVDDEPDGPSVPVDPPDAPRTLYGTVTSSRTDPVRPIVPAWVRNRDELRTVSRWAALHYAHSVAYHLTRVPKYLLRTVLRAPVGAWRITWSVTGWVFDFEGRPLRWDAVRRSDAVEYRSLIKVRAERVRLRLLVASAAAVVLLASGFALDLLAPWWVQALVLLVLVGALGWVGSPADRPLVDYTRSAPRYRKLTAEVVRRAFIAAKLAKEPGDIAFPAEIGRDGPGYRAVVDLPYGITAGEVVDKRPQLASGLDLALGQVWPEPVPGGSVRRVVLWVGDEDLSAQKPAPWPLIRRGSVDLFSPFTFGRDTRGNPVPITLMFTNVVIGAIPRMGKTFALRLLLLAAALDPSARLHVYDLKGGGDLVPLEPVAHRIGIGDEPELIEQGIVDVRGIQREMRRRYGKVRDLPPDICPEGKVTRALANRKDLGLEPVVLGVDECQVWFTHPEHGKEFEAILTDLVKRGPAVGIIVLLATQKPDRDSMPSGIRDNVGTRFAMRVTTWQTSEMITGTGMSKAGINAASLTRADKGIGYLVGASDDVEAQLVRADLCDGNAAATVVARARAAREGTGTITGQAAGEAVEKAPGSTLLDDLLLVIRGDARVHSETICERLTDLRPEQYHRLDPASLAAALKAYGITTDQLKIDGKNRRGITADQLTHALAERDAQLAIDPGDR